MEDGYRESTESWQTVLRDLKRRGLLDDTLVVWGGEFGRTPLGENRASKPGQPKMDPNELTLAMATQPVRSGQSLTFSIPLADQRSGPLTIRVHVAGDETWAAGGGQTNVRPPTH